MKPKNSMLHALDTIMSEGVAGADELNQALAKAHKLQDANNDKILYASWIDTALGPMLAVADLNALYSLEFFDRKNLLAQIKRLVQKTKAQIILGMPAPIIKLKEELQNYFLGELKTFTIPVMLVGTDFQKTAWDALLSVPYGETRSYHDQAVAIGRPSSHRAVANANGCNKIAILYPCHRIIRGDGSLGGYGGHVSRKKWLLELEKNQAHEKPRAFNLEK